MAAPVRQRRTTERLVLAAWLVLSVMALYFVGRYGVDVPRRDDLDLHPIYTGSGISLGWLWRLHNEHRLPLPRLVMYALAQVTGRDYLANGYLQVLLLSGLSWASIRVARRMRGEASATDAVLPLLWLHWGHAENWLMGFQVAVVLPIFVFVLLCLAAARTAEPLTRRAALGLGAGAALLPLCGAMGLVLAPFPALWLALVAWTSARRGARGTAVAAAVGAALPAVVVALYFVGYEARPSQSSGGALPPWLTAAGFLSMALGERGPQAWPLWIVVELVLVGATLGGLALVAQRRPSERLRLAGIALGVLGAVALGLAIGVGRPGHHGFNEGWARRYVVLATPFLGLAYVGACGLPARAGAALRWSFLALVAWAMPVNFVQGVTYGRSEERQAAGVVRDVLAGHDSRRLALHHSDWLLDDVPTLVQRLEGLRAANVGPFRLRDPHEEGRRASLFFMFDALPERWSSYRQGTHTVGDVSVWLSMPDGELAFRAPASATRITGRFGLVPESWRLYETDGVRFSVEAVERDGTPRVLFERHLHPLERPADREVQVFDLELPADTGGEILLSTSNLPGDTARGDAPFWTEIAFR